MSKSAVPDVGIVCRVRGEWIFREHSAVIMRCIRKGKNQDGKIIYSVRHSGKTPQAHPSVSAAENAEKHCPQHIEIRKELKCAASELEDVKYKVMKSAIQILKLW